MTLVQIDLRRGPAREPPAPARPHEDAAEGDHGGDYGAEHSGIATRSVPGDSLASAAAGLALAGGLVLLAPLAPLALTSRPALYLLLAGLAALGLIAALLRPALAAEVEPR